MEIELKLTTTMKNQVLELGFEWNDNGKNIGDTFDYEGVLYKIKRKKQYSDLREKILTLLNNEK